MSVRSDKDCTDNIKKEISGLDSIFDIYDEKSEISQLNALGKMNCSDDLSEFFREISELNETYGYKTDILAGNLTRLWHDSLEKNMVPESSDIQNFLRHTGRKNFSITGNCITLENGTTADPGAAAKGYALDRVFEKCIDKSSGHTIVSTGSTTLLYSSDENYVFSCGVKSDLDTVAGTAEVTSCFVSTSGDYERFTEISGVKYHHIIDTDTGYPADGGLSSVTVFCDSGIKSDFLSTLIFAEGKDNLDSYLDSDDFRVIAVDKQGNIYRSRSLVFHEASEK